MAFEGRHVLLEITATDEASFDQPLANIVDEVPQDRSPVVARRINMDHRISTNVDHSRGTK